MYSQNVEGGIKSFFFGGGGIKSYLNRSDSGEFV